MTTPGEPGRRLDDCDGISTNELRTARFILELGAQGIAGGDGGRRWVAMAMRGRRLREQLDAARPTHQDEMVELQVLALPREWREPFMWGYRWEPGP